MNKKVNKRVSKNQTLTIKLPPSVLALAEQSRRVFDEDIETFIIGGVLANCQTAYQEVEGHAELKRLWSEAAKASGCANPAL